MTCFDIKEIKKHNIVTKDSLMRMLFVISAVFFVSMQAVSAGNFTQDTENATAAINMASETTGTVLGLWVSPPLVYVLGVVIFGAIMAIIAGIIKGRRKGKG